jgi:hypothetical protein
VFGEDVVIAIAEPIQELGRALNIGEKKRDGPGWEFSHNKSVCVRFALERNSNLESSRKLFAGLFS